MDMNDLDVFSFEEVSTAETLIGRKCRAMFCDHEITVQILMTIGADRGVWLTLPSILCLVTFDTLTLDTYRFI